MKRLSTQDIRKRKGKEPVVVLTAYTADVARIADAYADVLLVGDSLGMVIYGMENTIGVTLEMMIRHAQAVMRRSEKTCVVVDMPFGSYQESKKQAFRNAARVMAETGCHAVKLEGGVEMAGTIRFLTERNIPVMGHIGLQPQRVHVYGGYRYQGRNDAQRKLILADAKAVSEAGAFSMVVEAVAQDLAGEITREVGIPTIGIGGSPECDGQVLVTEDLAGLTEQVPKFVKRYGNLAAVLEKAAKDFSAEVRARKFPTSAHMYGNES